MALSIKDPETDRLARALAHATGESLTEAIRRALAERLARETQRGTHYRMQTAVRRVQERLASLPVLDARDANELLGYDEHGAVELDALLRSFSTEVVAFDADQVAFARDAARTFGRGRHKAGLNFGDCFSYALAVSRGEPLLFVGDSFAKTDVSAVAW